MKRVFTDADPVLSGFVDSLLEAAGIQCLIRNHYLGGGVGELPVNECWPEVWVLHDEDESAAGRGYAIIALTTVANYKSLTLNHNL